MTKSLNSTLTSTFQSQGARIGRRAILAGIAAASAAPALPALADTDLILEQWRVWHRAYTEEMALEAHSGELYATIPERLQNPTVCMKWQGSDDPGHVCRFDWEIDSHAATIGDERTADAYKAELAGLLAERSAARDRLGLDEIGEQIMAVAEVRFAAAEVIDKIGGAAPVAIAARLSLEMVDRVLDLEPYQAARAAAIAQDLLPLLPADMAEGVGALSAGILASVEG